MTTELAEIASAILVKDGGTWPLNPSGAPQCDRCSQDAVRVSYSSATADSAVFFCGSCDENEPVTAEMYAAPIVRTQG